MSLFFQASKLSTDLQIADSEPKRIRPRNSGTGTLVNLRDASYGPVAVTHLPVMFHLLSLKKRPIPIFDPSGNRAFSSVITVEMEGSAHQRKDDFETWTQK